MAVDGVEIRVREGGVDAKVGDCAEVGIAIGVEVGMEMGGVLLRGMGEVEVGIVLRESAGSGEGEDMEIVGGVSSGVVEGIGMGSVDSRGEVVEGRVGVVWVVVEVVPRGEGSRCCVKETGLSN